MDVPKFIIDTDCGVDDAAALIMALDAHYRKEIKILAITCVAGNTDVDHVVKNVYRVLEVVKCLHVSVHGWGRLEIFTLIF